MGKRTLEGVLLFDGFCVLCSAFVRRVLRRFDGKLEVLPMQGVRGQALLVQSGMNMLPDEVILLMGKQVLQGADAVLYLLRVAGGGWPILARLGSWLPKPWVAVLYRKVARNRYVWFGKRKSCFVPER